MATDDHKEILPEQKAGTSLSTDSPPVAIDKATLLKMSILIIQFGGPPVSCDGVSVRVVN